MNEAVAIRVFVLNGDEVVRRGLCDLLESHGSSDRHQWKGGLET
jgi:hypothetical protein